MSTSRAPRSSEAKIRNKFLHSSNGNTDHGFGGNASTSAPTASSVEYDRLVVQLTTMGELYVYYSVHAYQGWVQEFHSAAGYNCKNIANQFFMFSLRSRISTMVPRFMLNDNAHAWVDALVDSAVETAYSQLNDLTPPEWWSVEFLCTWNADELSEFRYNRIQRWRPSCPPFPFLSYFVHLPVDLNDV